MPKPLFQPIYNPFSRYADKHEKKVDKLLNQLAQKDRIFINKKLLNLMQENLVVTNLWLEKRFKGYTYLTKWKRLALYKNSQELAISFRHFCHNNQVNEKLINEKLDELTPPFNHPDSRKKLKTIYCIMQFLKPGSYYEYLEGASFGKLLQIPGKKKMIGDCNQIVTLYTFLYSLNNPIRDLKIKLLPNHVCLHFGGIDIEATNASFQNYKDFTHLLSVSELISTNLLDTVDFRDKTLKIDARSFVKAAKLAIQISSIKEITRKNLDVAYHNLVINALQKNDFETAKFYSAKINDPKLTHTVYHNAAIYNTDKKNYRKARFYASHIKDKELDDYIKNQEGWNYYQNNSLTKAIKIFKEIPNEEMVKACYSKMYNVLQKKTAHLKTAPEHRAHKSDYRKMLDLARKMGNKEIEHNLTKLLDQIK